MDDPSNALAANAIADHTTPKFSAAVQLHWDNILHNNRPGNTIALEVGFSIF